MMNNSPREDDERVTARIQRSHDVLPTLFNTPSPLACASPLRTPASQPASSASAGFAVGYSPTHLGSEDLTATLFHGDSYDHTLLPCVSPHAQAPSQPSSTGALRRTPQPGSAAGIKVPSQPTSAGSTSSFALTAASVEACGDSTTASSTARFVSEDSSASYVAMDAIVASVEAVTAQDAGLVSSAAEQAWLRGFDKADNLRQTSSDSFSNLLSDISLLSRTSSLGSTLDGATSDLLDGAPTGIRSKSEEWVNKRPREPSFEDVGARVLVVAPAHAAAGPGGDALRAGKRQLRRATPPPWQKYDLMPLSHSSVGAAGGTESRGKSEREDAREAASAEGARVTASSGGGARATASWGPDHDRDRDRDAVHQLLRPLSIEALTNCDWCPTGFPPSWLDAKPYRQPRERQKPVPTASTTYADALQIPFCPTVDPK